MAQCKHVSSIRIKRTFAICCWRAAVLFKICGASRLHFCVHYRPPQMIAAFSTLPFPMKPSYYYSRSLVIIDKISKRENGGMSKISESPQYPSSLWASTCSKETSTALFASKLGQRRQARRDLPKRRNRRNEGNTASQQQKIANSPKSNTKGSDNSNLWSENSELRPLILSQKREAGVDYWIDPYELKKQKEREDAWKRLPTENQIPQDKLWTEVLSPYKQNWIGLISVVIVVIAFIVKNFPEVMNPPIISNVPDMI